MLRRGLWARPERERSQGGVEQRTFSEELSSPMAGQCEICGKQAQVGNRVTTRGKAKYLGGVGTKITGISKRRFKPNLQRVRVTTKGGTNRSMRVCAQCIRSGAVAKKIKSAPFKLPAKPAGVKAAK
jgi:large subunit ribosomal protein L28